MPSTVLVAPAEAIPGLRLQDALRDALSFVPAEALLALAAIRKSKPHVVAVERGFADSPAGQEFIATVTRDPSLAACEIVRVGLRRAARHRMPQTVPIQIDGQPASLIDISIVGCHVVSTSTLKPRQRIRVGLLEGEPPHIGLVVWSHFELPLAGARYRAGIEFARTADEAVRRLIAPPEATA